MNEQNNQKINIVNPLNPNQIIREEVLTKKIVQELNDDIEIPIIENRTEKKKSKFPFILIFLLIIIGAGISYYYFFIYEKSNNKPVTDGNQQQVVGISLNDISNSFNQNIINHKIMDNYSANASTKDNKIIVSVNLNEQIISYEFILNDKKLSTILSDNDSIGYEVTIYIFSAVAQYYNINFDDAYNYLNNNINDLNKINNISITNLEQTKNISVNIEEKLIIQ